jgi:hypothetical protein
MKLLVQIAVAVGAMVVIALVQPPFKQHSAAATPTKAASPSGRP